MLARVAVVAVAAGFGCDRSSKEPERVRAGAASTPASEPAKPAVLGTPLELKLPLGLSASALVIPDDNPLTVEKVELGKLLYFDERLSADGSVSCASCHDPAHAFADGKPVSTGIRGQKGGRSAPTVINRAFAAIQFWDGRAPSLEEQAKGPMTNPIEMGNPDHTVVVARLNALAGYRPYFRAAFGKDAVTIDDVARAIASFERTVLSGNAPFDRFVKGDKTALSASAQRGLELFRGKALCSTCHVGPNFSDEDFHNVGTGLDRKPSDLGRYEQVKEERFKGAFRTPTLREIAATAPYMSDGRFRTLEAVVDFYDKGGNKNPHLDPKMRPLGLTATEKADLVELMKSLSGEGWQHIKPPTSLPI